MVKNKQNWLIITQYFPPELGAPQIRLFAMAQELQNHGINVSVLTAMPNYPLGKIFDPYKNKLLIKENIGNINVKRTWVYGAAGNSSLLRILNYLSFTFTAAIAALTGPKPDLVFLESQPLSLGIVAILLKWFRRVPYIYNIPDLQIEVAKEMNFIRNSWFLRVSNNLDMFFMKNSWKISTVTKSFITHIEKKGYDKNKITFLPNGADTNFLKRLKPNKSLIEKWHLQNKKIFLYVGTHAYYHGLGTIVDAAELLKTHKDIVILLIGQGPVKSDLITQAKAKNLDNVIFDDSPYEERAKLYSIAYCSIVTIKNIPIAKQMRPAKLFPSLSCEVPVIFSGAGETATLIKTNNCGIIVEPENPSALAKAILSISKNEKYKNELGKAGREMVKKSYSWKTIIDNWIQQLN